jgi:HEAT repeat protein
MSQAGGSSTINGILYQILACLDWAVSLSINATLDKDDFSEAYLIIEPAGGGGDIRIETQSKRIVEQWKAKSNYGTWSLNQIIEEVIPDLYLAVSCQSAVNSEYYFVTEGRKGTWKEAFIFFKSLTARSYKNDPSEALDNKQIIKFFPKESEACSEQALFYTICQEVRKRQAVSNEPEIETRKKLWCLLSNFDLKEAVKAEYLKDKINGFLIGIVEHREEADAKRRELCGIVLDLASKGEVKITPSELLQKAGLSKESFRNWPTFKNTLSHILQRELQRKQYSVEKDVRNMPDWPSLMPILVIAGDSGQGKTWQLAKTAYEIDGRGNIAVFLTTRGNAIADLNAIADVVWKKGLNKDESHSLDRVAARLTEVVPKVPKPWLTACVDDVQSIAEARNLINFEWEVCGIRLAITVSLAIGRAIKKQYLEKVHLVETNDFTSSELRLFLTLHSRIWGSIPTDVRKTLHRPLLANLYCEIATDQSWTPTTEYELFERHWLRIKDDGDQADYPHDTLQMLKLVDSLLEEDRRYPWPSELLDRLGIDNATRKRLENIGWLQTDENGDAIIWHDRLLNWALSEALVRRKQLNKISTQELGRRLVEYYWQKPGHEGKSFGYVPMDLLWIASDPKQGMADDVPVLISSLEKPEQGINVGSLFEEMLPTLGRRVIPALIVRLRETIEERYYSILITKALIRIGEKNEEDIKQVAEGLLSDKQTALQSVGMEILQKYPSRESLDRIWDLHKINIDNLNDKGNNNRHWHYDQSFSALQSCVKQDPRWIVKQIQKPDAAHSPVSELAYLLANIGEDETQLLWHEVKSELMALVPEKKLRSLVACIRRYRDKDEIPRLESWVSKEEDFLGPFAFSALAELAPDIALAKLSTIPTTNLAFMRNWWLSQLRIRMPEKTDEKIIELMKATGSDPWRIAAIFDGNEYDITVPVLDILLDTVEQEIERQYDQLIINDHPWLYLRLSFLAKIYRPELLERFEARASTKLEQRLIALIFVWEDQENSILRRELPYARLVVRKIGGQGITQIVNHELSHINEQIRILGLQWSVMQPDQTTRLLIRKIAKSDNISGNPPYPHEQILATSVLAVLGEDDAVIDSIIKWAPKIPDDLYEIRYGKPPMNDESLINLPPLVKDADETSLCKAVLAMGISGRKDFIPQVREILIASKEGSELARNAIESLKHLDGIDVHILDRLGRELLVKENRVVAANALLRNSTADALNIMENYVLSLGAKTLNEEEQIALIVWKKKPNKLIIDNILWNVKHNFFWSSKCLEEVGTLNDLQVVDLLWEIISSSESTMHIVGRTVAAIRGLSKNNPEAAFQAAILQLDHSTRDRELLPKILVELEPLRAVPILINQLIKESQTLTRWAIGRALRKLRRTNTDIISQEVMKLIDSTDYNARVAGAELSGWQGPQFNSEILTKLACDDFNMTVRNASLRAFERQKDEHAVVQLMVNYQSANSSKKWTILEAIIELGDPLLLKTPDDSIGLANILKDESVPLVNYAMDSLERRIKEIKEQAEKQDRDR